MWWDLGTTEKRPPRSRSLSIMMYRARNTELIIYAKITTTRVENSMAFEATILAT
jgi:hypothetical protein